MVLFSDIDFNVHVINYFSLTSDILQGIDQKTRHQEVTVSHAFHHKGQVHHLLSLQLAQEGQFEIDYSFRDISNQSQILFGVPELQINDSQWLCLKYVDFIVMQQVL